MNSVEILEKEGIVIAFWRPSKYSNSNTVDEKRGKMDSLAARLSPAQSLDRKFKSDALKERS